ncbi:AMP-binding protein [Amaricoccus solimangrovi]|uniref:3-methylmercaptopropionyl-CoA ligase n=1 Tax=Amaricoccus solimangrovi TaxID=2589815 RepID=A0A501WJ90_9RHOB|nr:AMP-binding protein [Amaricoccus solimangrovi]TPE48194.1 AMP-binding protein [Amaricoccus solimangrovi]
MDDWIAPDPVALHALGRPEKRALADLASGREWTYGALDRAIDKASAALAELGLAPGERLAVLARNSADLVIAQQAAMRMGAIFTPLNWRLAPAELAPILADCAPKLLLGDGTVSVEAPEGCRAVSLADFVAASEATAPVSRRPERKAGDPCVILYTSGTSGVSKGVILTPRTLFFTGVNFGVLGGVSHSSVFLCESPMFHVIGLVTSIWPPFLQGGTVLVSPGFDPAATNRRLADPALGITHYFCVPQMAEALRHAEDFRPDRWSLTALFTGGAPNPPANIRWWIDQGVAMVDGFGMTEAGTILGMPLEPDLIATHAGGVGFAGPATAVRIVDLHDRDVPDGTAGEILVKGPNVTPGYWNRPEERARAFTEDGWLRTGDIARRDADGYIAIVDRRKDMFISGGENVYPVEIEAVLVEHPGVMEVAVIGVPDARWGEVGCAFVVPKPGAGLTEEELARHCEARLARYKVPKVFRIEDQLPRTGTGKVQKHRLREAVLTPTD